MVQEELAAGEFEHPLTKKRFTDREEYAEALMDSYIANAREAFGVSADNAALVSALDALVESPERKGTFQVSGREHVAKVTRRVNVTYEKPRGAPHPLRGLMTVYPELADMVKVDYEEKGAQVADLLEKFRDHAFHEVRDEDKIRLAEELLKVRKVAPGKPGIKVEDRKDGGAPGVGDSDAADDAG